MKKRGHTIDEYGDRWVDTTSDTTVWKPGFGADKLAAAHSRRKRSLEACPTATSSRRKGGIEWTSSETHTTGRSVGAVLANAGKAAGAGWKFPAVGPPCDWQKRGKGAEAAGIEVDPQLRGPDRGPQGTPDARAGRRGGSRADQATKTGR